HAVGWLISVEDLVLPALSSSMNGVRSTVDIKLNGITIQHKLSIGDTVGVTSHSSTERGRHCKVLIDVIKTKYYVTENAFGIRHHQGNHSTAIVSNAYCQAGCIRQEKKISGIAVHCPLEPLPFQTRFRLRAARI